jgi:hypothetical protein
MERTERRFRNKKKLKQNAEGIALKTGGSVLIFVSPYKTPALQYSITLFII